MTSYPVWLTSAVALCLSGPLDAATTTPLPAWYVSVAPNMTREGYSFTTGSLTPSPDAEFHNTIGPVSSQVVLGAFSDGWQDPLDPIDLSGVNSDGAWDLGTGGTISTSASVAPSAAVPGFYYHVEFQVYVVAYRGITSLPAFSSTFTPQNLQMVQATVATDPLFPGASWDSRTWTGYFDTTNPVPVTFTVSAPANNTSVVDTYEVFTRYILVPEPSAALLGVLSLFGVGLRRRRR